MPARAEPGPVLDGWRSSSVGATSWAAVAISASDGRDVWMAGEGGTLLHTPDAGKTFEVCKMHVSEPLLAISVVSADDVWILSEEQVHHVEHGRVETLAFGLKTHCGVPSNGIFATARDVWIANGEHLHSGDRGKTWRRVDACGGGHHTCASEISGRGSVLFGDCSFGITGSTDAGKQWAQASFHTGTEEQLHVGVGPDDVWAIGQDSRSLGWHAAGGWSEESLGETTPSDELRRAWSITSAGHGWAWVVASDGLWARHGKRPWVREETSGVVKAIAAGPNMVWAVGAHGLVAHRSAP